MDWLKALWDMVVQNWEWILAVAVPFVVATISKSNWSSTAKGWSAIVGSLAIGVVAAFVQGIPLEPASLTMFLAAVVGVTQVAYRIFRSFGITSAWLDKLLGWRDVTAPQILNE